MKGKRLVDVLEDTMDSSVRTFWQKIFTKLSLLSTKIEATNPSIDDPELRWCTDRLEYWESEDRLLTKKEMQIANLYWKKYNLK